VVAVGVGGVVGFVENAFLADLTTQSENGISASDLQSHKDITRDLAFADLGFGVMGILARKIRGSFWLATITGYSVFSIGSSCSYIFGGAVSEGPVSVSGTISQDMYVSLFLAFAMIGLWTVLWLIRLRDKTETANL
jgi:hypothetical protein